MVDHNASYDRVQFAGGITQLYDRIAEVDRKADAARIGIGKVLLLFAEAKTRLDHIEKKLTRLSKKSWKLQKIAK